MTAYAIIKLWDDGQWSTVLDVGPFASAVDAMEVIKLLPIAGGCVGFAVRKVTI